ncbi:MAG: flagellar hook-basal body complex protein FliE [Planctomycetota bacterium]|jgi:flagellar hook-basal body complex protein FliE
MTSINPLSAQSILPKPTLESSGSAQEKSPFKDMLLSSIREVNSMQQAADQAVEALASGQEVNTAEVLTAVQKADIAFRLMMQIRNKVVQAYQEVQNIRV